MLKIKDCRKFMKVCSECGQLKLVIYFGKDKYMKDGYRKQCKICKKNISKKYNKICPICNKEFKTLEKDQICCSVGCSNTYKAELDGRNRHLVKCNNCDNEYYISDYEYKKNKSNIFYCSNQCKFEYNNIFVSCNYCNKLFPKNMSDIKNKNFCCKECSVMWKKENGIYKGENNPNYGNGNKIRGENNPNYNPNLTQEEREQKRNYPEYKQFIQDVLKRDNYTCQCCGDNKGGNLNAHHLNGYNWDKEHRTDVNNGITLCDKCHNEFHKLYRYGNNTKEQFEEFKLNKELNESA